MSCTAARHGDANAYDHHGCRCPQAVRMRIRQMKRARLLAHQGYPTEMDATGARRRLQALACMGWGIHTLAAATGGSVSSMYRIRGGRQPNVWRPMYESIVREYDRLSLTRGPCAKSATWARKHGWAPPLAYDDDTIDDPKARPRGVRWDVAS